MLKKKQLKHLSLQVNKLQNHHKNLLIKRIKKHTKKPLCVGFGISRPEHVKSIIKAGADGAIVGSAIVNIIEKNSSLKSKKSISI